MNILSETVSTLYLTSDFQRTTIEAGVVGMGVACFKRLHECYIVSIWEGQRSDHVKIMNGIRESSDFCVQDFLIKCGSREEEVLHS